MEPFTYPLQRIALGPGSTISALIVLFYFTLLLGAYGQTVGMMALKIKVVKEDGSKIGYVDALVRSLLLIIDAIPFIIPFLLGAILIWTLERDSGLETVQRTPL